MRYQKIEPIKKRRSDFQIIQINNVKPNLVIGIIVSIRQSVTLYIDIDVSYTVLFIT